MKFGGMTVGQLLEALASAEPTPGGGTASAVAGAMGVSLLVMVTKLAKSRTNTDNEKLALETARTALTPLGAELMHLADADTAAFNRVMEAYRAPKASDEEKAARTRSIQTALEGATVVPLETLRACAAALAQARVVAEHGNRSAASDAGVAVGLLRAAATGADANVQINLSGITNEAFASATAAEAKRLLEAAGTDADAAMRALV
jgi:formiminotetrahydrofolate cyclodeaminase